MGLDGSVISDITITDSGLSRMTTIRKVFEKFEVNINTDTLQNIY